MAAGDERKVAIELLGVGGKVTESVELTGAELLSPPVVGFSGEELVGSANTTGVGDSEQIFEADGDHPLCVTSACIPVTLSWAAPLGSKVSIISEGETLREGYPPHGSLKVVGSRSRSYTRRMWLLGAQEDTFSDLTVEVRRYPSLSLVMEGARFKVGSLVEFGASISCAA
jgi:hypothetical protein